MLLLILDKIVLLEAIRTINQVQLYLYLLGYRNFRLILSLLDFKALDFKVLDFKAKENLGCS